MKGYMAYSRRSPLILGCRPELLAEPPGLAETLGRVVSSKSISLYKSTKDLLRSLFPRGSALLIHSSEQELWQENLLRIVPYRGKPEDLAREACRQGVEGVLLHHVHPITGELRPLRAVLEEAEVCRKPLRVVADLSLSAGLIDAPKPWNRHVLFYRLDKWLMGPPIVAAHSSDPLPGGGVGGWDARCAAASLQASLSEMLHSAGIRRLDLLVDELSWEIDRLGLRSPTPPEKDRRAFMVSIHAGGAAERVARIIASRGIVVDTYGGFIRIAPHTDASRSDLARLLTGLAEARRLLA